MKSSLIAAAAFGLIVQVAAAQQFQGLGAADPSQQLKTAGMMNTFQNRADTFKRDERKEPLVQGTSDPSDIGERQTGDAQRQLQPEPQPQATPSPWPSPSPVPPAYTTEPAPASSEALKPVPVQARGATRPAAQWNPASQAATAPAPEVVPTARQSRVQELIDQIKRRREAR